jgi:hypothetical protein
MSVFDITVEKSNRLDDNGNVRQLQLGAKQKRRGY